MQRSEWNDSLPTFTLRQSLLCSYRHTRLHVKDASQNNATVRDWINNEAIFPIRIHVAEGDSMQMLKKNTRTIQCSVRFSHSNPNTTAMRKEISTQLENKDYRDATT